MKKAFYVLLILYIAVILMIGASLSAGAATSGQVGNCQWSLDGTVLNISGNGSLNVDYGNAPWGKSITEVKINEDITSISAGAFADCTAIYKVTLPSSLKVIDYGAFSNCTALTSITIPSGLTTIGNYAFSNCSALVDITLPKTVTYIGVEAFNECYSMNNIFVDPDNLSFTSVDGVLFSKDKRVLVRYPSDKSEQTYAVPDGVKEISMGAFEAAWNLLDITLPDSITKIGFNAFFMTIPYNDSSRVYDGCFYLGNHLIVVKNKNITSCTVRDGTKTIADGAFVSSRLEQVTMPEGLLQIGDSAFSWCSALKSVYIPKSVTKIDSSAFYDCNAIESVFYSGSASECSKITIGMQNTSLTGASWKYNSCYGGKDHDFQSAVITQNATCTEAGEKDLICSVCTAVVNEKIEATGHKYGQWSQTKPSTCVSTGTEERRCTVCLDLETRTLDVTGHVYGPWTVEIDASCDDVGVEKRTCVLCQGFEAQNIEPKGHSYTKWSVDTEPTCVENGVEKKVCSNCDLFETRDISAIGHSYGEIETVKKPTLTQTGLKRAVCKRCGDVKAMPLDKIDPKGYIIVACIGSVAALIAVVAVLVIIKKKRADSPKMQK